MGECRYSLGEGGSELAQSRKEKPDVVHLKGRKRIGSHSKKKRPHASRKNQNRPIL